MVCTQGFSFISMGLVDFPYYCLLLDAYHYHYLDRCLTCEISNEWAWIVVGRHLYAWSLVNAPDKVRIHPNIENLI